jgi:hypothetical protein
MAYTPTPGRGNGPKTGAGLPTSLNSGSAANTEIEKTSNYTKSQKSIKEGISNNKGKFGATTLNETTGSQEADAYEPRYVKGKGDTPDQVVSGGKVIRKSVVAGMENKTNPAYYNYRNNKSQTKEDLYAGYKADSTANMSSRNRSANYVNIRTGAKQDLNEADKKDLMQFGLAKKVN